VLAGKGENMTADGELSVALGGFGAIGGALARRLDRGLPGLRLVAVSARDVGRAERRLAELARPVPVVPLGALAAAADLVVECAPAAVFREIALPAIEAGRIFMPVSVGQLLEQEDLVARAAATGARIIVPTGALLGLDAVRAAAEGEIRSVTMVTRKPPGGLAGAPYLEQHGIRLDDLRAPLKVFDGSARDGARGFPANVNVAAALSLAGIGPDRTRLEIWADPGVSRNTHRIVVEADSARFEMTIENVPSEANPRTGKITALSVIAALRGLGATLRVGS
jgi:aspartate dehydrogenase